MVDILHINWRIIRIPSTVVRGLPCHHLISNPQKLEKPEKKHQGTTPTTWQSLGRLILSMVTVGADMVDPVILQVIHQAHQNFTRKFSEIFRHPTLPMLCVCVKGHPPRLSVLHPRIQLVFRVYWGDKSHLQLGFCCPFTAGVEMMVSHLHPSTFVATSMNFIHPKTILFEWSFRKDYCFCKGLSFPYAPIPSASGFGVGFGYLNTF